MPMTAVEMKNVTVRLQDTDVLSGISVSIDAGAYVGIVGPNGSGKTTFVRTVLGLISPAEGEARLFGRVASAATLARVGYLPQKAMLADRRFPATVAEVISSGLLVKRPFPRLSARADRARVNEAMDMMAIGDLASRPVGRLSGGQQQRVLLARALVGRPDLLILDEPTAALDPKSREAFYGLLQHLNKVHGTTVLLVSHDIATVGKFSSRLLYLDGKVVFFGGFDEFCHSEAMSGYFGQATQHVICHRHQDGEDG